jgi:hypothetical protein
MIYYPNLKIVYCPVERTASRSTEQYLDLHDPDNYRLGSHRHSCDISELNNIEYTHVYVSKRHPWDRLCSMYAASKEMYDSGYQKYWESIDSYLDFLTANESNPFLLENNPVIPNVFCPMHKLIGNEVVHFYRSQSHYRNQLNGINLDFLDYFTPITGTWVNPAIAYPEIGSTDNQANELWTTERENKLKTLWNSDYAGYSDWSINNGN